MKIFVADPLDRKYLYSMLSSKLMQVYSPSSKKFEDDPADALVSPVWFTATNHTGIGIILFDGLEQPLVFGEYLLTAHYPDTKKPVGPAIPVAPMAPASTPTINIGVVNLGQ